MQITVRNLSHTYNGNPSRRALDDLSFEVESGQFVAIIGPSGCGKSTLLRLIAGLLQPSQGTIELNGCPPAELVAARRIAWMAQSPAILPWLTVRSNIALAQRFHRKGIAPLMTPEEALQRVGLTDASQAYPFMLSGGMQQRLVLARTLTQDASLWLMDEPFASLDELTRERLTYELIELWQPLRPTVLWVTHNIHEALRLSDRVLVIRACPGNIIADLRVTLPRPRLESSSKFQDLLSELRAALEESMIGEAA